jgi:hypothetical protein
VVDGSHAKSNVLVDGLGGEVLVDGLGGDDGYQHGKKQNCHLQENTKKSEALDAKKLNTHQELHVCWSMWVEMVDVE